MFDSSKRKIFGNINKMVGLPHSSCLYAKRIYGVCQLPTVRNFVVFSS
jgi:hypothetical protein